MATMKAAQVLTKGQMHYTIHDVPKPTLGPKDLLIKIGAAGFCHTDMTVLRGLDEIMTFKLPITGSHEPAGTVVEMGPEVQGFKIGDRVGAISFQYACHSCSDCKSGTPQYCEKLGGYFGFTIDGAFAKYAKLDSEFAVPIPDGISFVQAAPLMCAGPTVYQAIKSCNLEPGSKIAIVGLGALGHLGIQFAKALGYQVVGVDVKDAALDMVTASDFPLPADVVVNSAKTTPEDALKSIEEKLGKTMKGYSGVDGVVVCADARGALKFGMDIVAMHGVIVVVSLPQGSWEVNPNKLVFKDITIKSSLLIDVKGAKEMMDVASKKGVKTSITKIWKLDDINEMLKEFEKPSMCGKFVVSFED